jgi:large subunit ribosomal protein L7/L12
MNGRSWSPEVKDLGDRIVALTIVRAAELSDYLESVHHVRVAATAGVVTLRDDDTVSWEPPPPPTEFDLVLEGYETTSKIAVIKVVRELTALGLKEAKELVEGAPRTVKEGLPQAEGEKLKARLEAAGARVVLKGR